MALLVTPADGDTTSLLGDFCFSVQRTVIYKTSVTTAQFRFIFKNQDAQIVNGYSK